MDDTGINTSAGLETGAGILGKPGGNSAAGTAPIDRSFDLSLRLLTVLVSVALGASACLLLYRWLAPRFAHYDAEPVAARANHAAPAPKATDVNPAHVDEVLMDPGRVFKCEDQGRVSFSDQACTGAPASAPGPASGSGGAGGSDDHPRSGPPAGPTAGPH